MKKIIFGFFLVLFLVFATIVVAETTAPCPEQQAVKVVRGPRGPQGARGPVGTQGPQGEVSGTSSSTGKHF